MNQTAWLVRRAVLAVVLLIGFYVLAVALALGLLWIPYAEWVYVDRVHFRIAAACIGGAVAILWAITPRIDRFEPPGPRLDASEHPRLFRVIGEVAAATRQPPPEDVYLLNDVNAWVSHRGGMMGFGSRRVMGIGLPLLQALPLTEFKAVIAHEFGHYSSGDVSLGPWIYKTRAAIGRAIAGTRETLLEAPFQWYGRLFLRITHGVSREQEFIADRVAADVAGAQALGNALRRTTALDPLFSNYLRHEVSPVLSAGFLPPIADGFTTYLGDERIQHASHELIQRGEEQVVTDDFDTHPCLRDRLAALGVTAPITASAEEPAGVLLDDLERQTRVMTGFLLGEESISRLRPIAWERVAESVYASQWRAAVNGHARLLATLTADALPTGKRAFISLGSQFIDRDEESLDGEARIARAIWVIGAALGTLLLDQGWSPQTSPGRPVVLIHDGQEFDPIQAAGELADERITNEEWTSRCLNLGIASRPLASSAAAQQA